MSPRSRGGVAAAVTSHDVARLVGVSQATVSRALRDDPRVSGNTRSKVRDAAKLLGYVPSEAGRSLSTRSTRQIAMVADLSNPLYPTLVAPIHDALLELGYRMVLLAERGDGAGLWERLVDRSVDGVILTTTMLHSTLPYRLQQRGIPFVQVNRVTDTVPAHSVTADNVAGAASAASLLVTSGHRRVAAILGPQDSSTSRDREVGFRRTLDEAGIGLPAKWVYRGEAYSHADGIDGFTHVMRARSRPTAVLCANDLMAIGALNTAIARGMTVPDDVSIIGYDDLDIASWPAFRLTTVRVDLDAMARRAAEVLISTMDDAGASGEVHTESFPTELVLRSTHATR